MNFRLKIGLTRPAAPAIGALGAFALAACGGGGGGTSMTTTTPPPMTAQFADTALVSNGTGVVATTTIIDANLQNPWGIAVGPGLPFWIADNNSNLSTLYTGTGQIETGAVTGSNSAGIAIAASAAGVQANPTGQVYNGNGGFQISTSKGLESALFIFDGEGGTLSAWAQDSGAATVTAYDDGVANGTDHAVYKGLAIGSVGGVFYLYATDLHNNKIDVFDTSFSKPSALQGKFVDPNMPTGFVPFGITAVANQLYVTYTMRDAAMHDEVTGAGLGYIDVFDFSGNFVSRFASAGVLNAPWGIAVAPSGFGTLQGDLLVGNFGDGHINIFSPEGDSMGALSVSNGGSVAIPGLWSLVFGNGDSDKPATTLFYTAGFADQTDGVFGTITPSSTSNPSPY
jgi:uncharacterized protein (TIGR03118 family)